MAEPPPSSSSLVESMATLQKDRPIRDFSLSELQSTFGYPGTREIKLSEIDFSRNLRPDHKATALENVIASTGLDLTHFLTVQEHPLPLEERKPPG